MRRIFVGNISYRGSESDITDFVVNDLGIRTLQVELILDRETGRSKGIGFLDLHDEADLEEAILKINGAMFLGRRLKASEAFAKPHILSNTSSRRDRV